MVSRFDLLLVGAGHAHSSVLRQWASYPAHKGRIALISPSPYAWYSGMMPGLLAGQYRPEQCRLYLPPLCKAAGVEFIEGTVVGLKATLRQVQLADGSHLEGRWLSLNTGAVPRMPENLTSSADICPVKPFSDFINILRRWQEDPKSVAVLGGGAAGVEMALAFAPQVPSLALFSAGDLLRGHTPALRKRVLNHLQRHQITIHENCAIDAISDEGLLTGQECVWRGSRIILATGPAPLAWWQQSGLLCDEQGFIQSSSTLQSPSHPYVFATGDCATIAGALKSGVYALRQGTVLGYNLASLFSQKPLRHYKPADSALALIADGSGGALMSWGHWSAEGRWAGLWKCFLDKRFIRRHSV